MGTRHLIMAVIDGQTKLAQYGQWDGYPTGQGKAILEFLNRLFEERMDILINNFYPNLRSTRFATDDEIEQGYIAAGAKPDDSFISSEIVERFQQSFPAMNRDLGARVLNMILDTPNLVLKDSTKFAKDGLFCEWAYVLDFDEGHLEVYRGFHKEPAPEGHNISRFGDEPDPHNDPHNGQFTYYPVRLIKTYTFDNLPDAETLDAECDPPEPEASE